MRAAEQSQVQKLEVQEVVLCTLWICKNFHNKKFSTKEKKMEGCLEWMTVGLMYWTSPIIGSHMPLLISQKHFILTCIYSFKKIKLEELSNSKGIFLSISSNHKQKKKVNGWRTEVQTVPWRAPLQDPVWAVTEECLLGNSHHVMEHKPSMTVPRTGKMGLFRV